MIDVSMAFKLGIDGQSDECVSLSSRDRMMRRVQAMNFLKESAAYLGVAVTSGQLRSLIERQGNKERRSPGHQTSASHQAKQDWY